MVRRGSQRHLALEEFARLHDRGQDATDDEIATMVVGNASIARMESVRRRVADLYAMGLVEQSSIRVSRYDTTREKRAGTITLSGLYVIAELDR